MANRLKHVVSTVLCATVMLTMTAVPGAVFAQTDTDSSEQPETTAQTENQATTPEHEAEEAAQETKQTPEPSQETAQAPAKQQKAAAQPQVSKNEAKVATQAAIAPYSFDGINITVTPADKYSSATKTITVCKGTTVTLKANLINATGKKYHYMWFKKGNPFFIDDSSTLHVKREGTYYVGVQESIDVRTYRESIEIKVVFEDHSNPLVPHGAKAATCKEEGHYAYWSCSKCGKLFSNASGTKTYEKIPTIPKKAHEITTHASRLEATCTTDGHKEHWACTNCGDVFLDQAGNNPTTKEAVTLNATGHNMTKTDAKAATCTEDGNHEYYICENCGKVFTDESGNTETTVKAQEIPAHGLIHVDAKVATCTESGNIEHWQCSKESCGKLFSDQDGENSVTLEDVTLDATGHDMTKTDAKAATCTENGYVEYWTCNKCKKMFADEAGEKEISGPELIPAGHNLTKHDAKEATCTENGNYEYYTCSGCDKIFRNNDMTFEFENEAATIIPATGHKFGEWTVKKPAGIGTEGLKERICEKCGHVETAAIPALEANKADLNNKTELAQKTAEEKTDKSAKTGDDSSIALYALLTLLAAGGACGTVYRRKLNG